MKKIKIHYCSRKFCDLLVWIDCCLSVRCWQVMVEVMGHTALQMNITHSHINMELNSSFTNAVFTQIFHFDHKEQGEYNLGELSSLLLNTLL